MPKEWKAIEILFHGHESTSSVETKKIVYNQLAFHARMTGKLNEYQIGPGEFTFTQPQLVSEDLFIVILYLFTDKDVGVSWVPKDAF